MIGLTTALDQLLALGESRLEEHSRSLSNMLIEGVGANGWKPFRAIEDSSASPHIVALNHPEHSVEKTMDALGSNRIICGNRNGRIRISLAPYNNSDDINALIDVLAKL